MNILSMNIWGFGGLSKQKSLNSLFSDLNPDMSLLQETMCTSYQSLIMFSKFKPRWQFCAVDAFGLSGGLLAGWNPSLSVVKLSPLLRASFSKPTLKGFMRFSLFLTAMDLMLR